MNSKPGQLSGSHHYFFIYDRDDMIMIGTIIVTVKFIYDNVNVTQILGGLIWGFKNDSQMHVLRIIYEFDDVKMHFLAKFSKRLAFQAGSHKLVSMPSSHSFPWVFSTTKCSKLKIICRFDLRFLEFEVIFVCLNRKFPFLSTN